MRGIVKCRMLLSLCVLTVALSGCEHKELCYDHGHSVEVEFRFNWEAAPDADPNTMVVSFFTLDGEYVACREFSSRDGGMTKMEAGEYKLLFHNGEMDNVREVPGDFGSYSLTTVDESLLAPMSRYMDAPPRPAPSADEPVRTAAERVWAGTHGYLMLEHGSGHTVVELYPEEVTAVYTVEVVNVENLRDNIFTSAALSGISERHCVSSGRPSGVPVTVPFSLMHKGNDRLEARFLTFGHCPEDNSVRHILSVYTSSMTYYDYDVTSQVHEAPDEKNIHIRIDGLRLPAEGEGMSPSVEDWDNVENVEIGMR